MERIRGILFFLNARFMAVISRHIYNVFMQMRWRWLIPGVGSIFLWAALSALFYMTWTHGADHRDFYPRWAGARLALFEHQDPYSLESTRQIQLELYGRELPDGVDQQGFAYPAQLIVELLPFWFIGNVEVATAVWQGLSVLGVIWIAVLLHGVQEKIPFPLLLCMLIWQYPILMIFQGQVTVLPLAAFGIGYWAYLQRRDHLAGFVLAFGLVKPELMLLPLAAFIYLALRERRWAFLTSLFLSEVALFLSSVVIAGWWVPGWISAVNRYAQYAQTSWAPGIVGEIHPSLTILLLLLIGLILLKLRHESRVLLSCSIPLGMLLFPQTLIWGLTLLVAPLVLLWKRTSRWGIFGVWAAGWLLILTSPWQWGWKIQNLLIPTLTLGLIYWAARFPARVRLDNRLPG